MENLKKMKECLMSKVESQIYGHLDEVDAKELGKAVDMIKDLSEAIYYCTITKAMEGEDEEKEHKNKQHSMYYSKRSLPPMEPYYPIEYYDPRYRERMNYMPMYAQGTGSGSSNSGNGGSMSGGMRGYSEGNYPTHSEHEYPVSHVYRDGAMRDPHEGKSGQRRKMYMESKQTKDKNKQMQELDAYMQELAADMTDMIADASPEEKQLLQSKISMLATKIK